MEKSAAGVLRVVLLLVAAAGCAEVATTLGDPEGPATSPPTVGLDAAQPATPSSPGRARGVGEPGARESAVDGTAEASAVAGITAAHNRIRARVGVPPLQWNTALADVARRWANACVDREPPRGMIDHSSGRADGFAGPIGENLYATTAPWADAGQAVAGWAEEAADYDYDSNRCRGSMCGHYTQLVWGATREVGCAVGSCPNLEFRSTLVCNYAPAGNIVGERPY